MQKQLGPIEIACDAPSYGIVRSCTELGFENPLDVRWLRLDHVIGGRDPSKQRAVHAWTAALRLIRPTEPTCSCGQALPLVERCTFILRSGIQVDYLLGQCQRCKTIFWQPL
jgi:hypothetical protein